MAQDVPASGRLVEHAYGYIVAFVLTLDICALTTSGQLPKHNIMGGGRRRHVYRTIHSARGNGRNRPKP